MPDTSTEYHTVCMVIASTYIELAASLANRVMFGDDQCCIFFGKSMLYKYPFRCICTLFTFYELTSMMDEYTAFLFWCMGILPLNVVFDILLYMYIFSSVYTPAKMEARTPSTTTTKIKYIHVRKNILLREKGNICPQKNGNIYSFKNCTIYEFLRKVVYTLKKWSVCTPYNGHDQESENLHVVKEVYTLLFYMGI